MEDNAKYKKYQKERDIWQFLAWFGKNRVDLLMRAEVDGRMARKKRVANETRKLSYRKKVEASKAVLGDKRTD